MKEIERGREGKEGGGGRERGEEEGEGGEDGRGGREGVVGWKTRCIEGAKCTQYLTLTHNATICNEQFAIAALCSE